MVGAVKIMCGKTGVERVVMFPYKSNDRIGPANDDCGYEDCGCGGNSPTRPRAESDVSVVSTRAPSEAVAEPDGSAFVEHSPVVGNLGGNEDTEKGDEASIDVSLPAEDVLPSSVNRPMLPMVRQPQGPNLSRTEFLELRLGLRSFRGLRLRNALPSFLNPLKLVMEVPGLMDRCANTFELPVFLAVTRLSNV